MSYGILGPHPANHSYSIVRYFNFYRNRLPQYLSSQLLPSCPGRQLPAEDALPSSPRLNVWYENYAEWPLSLLRLKTDVNHIVDQGLLWYGAFLRSGRRVGTVHDLINHLYGRSQLKFGGNIIERENMRQLLRLDFIISVSRFTADCVIRETGVPASRIAVIPNHVDDRFRPPSEEERARNRKKWFGGAEHALIHIGRPLRYKNRLGAIKAVSLVRRRLPEARMFLINGPCAPDEREFLDTEPDSGAAFRFIPAVAADELTEIYGAADALVFPSYHEGFGWPPLEAMACGCPVVSSTCASLREVVAQAALTVDDPDDHKRMAEHLVKILLDPATAADLRRAGVNRASLFAPEKSLRDVSSVYQMLA